MSIKSTVNAVLLWFLCHAHADAVLYIVAATDLLGPNQFDISIDV